MRISTLISKTSIIQPIFRSLENFTEINKHTRGPSRDITNNIKNEDMKEQMENLLHKVKDCLHLADEVQEVNSKK